MKHAPQAQLAFEFALPELTYKLRDYWQDAAERVDAPTIEIAIVTTYRKTGSVSRSATILAFSPTTIRRKLHALREPLRKRGGKNNPWGRRGKPGREDYGYYVA